MEEKKEQIVAEFADIFIKNVTKYVEENVDEICDAIITDELMDCVEEIEEVFGCEIFSGNVNEEFNEMFPRILFDRLKTMSGNQI